MNKFNKINLGGYEGSFECPYCGYSIDISQGNALEEPIFTCPEYDGDNSGCGKEWQVYASEVIND